MRKPGCIEPVIYFRNGTDPAHVPGYLLLAPYSDFPTPPGYSREAADTLAEVDRLEATLVAQERAQISLEAQADDYQFEPLRQAVRDKLYARMTSGECPPFERDFIKSYLQLRNDKRPRYQQRYLEYTSYLWARHHDIGKGRGADQEIFKAERHTVNSDG